MATWANTFFSDNPPEFINEVENCPSFRGFSPGTNQWCLGAHVDRSRRVDSTRIQVFWLQIKGRRDHVAKVFPDYTLDQAARQLWQLRFYEYKIMSQIDKARYEFDPFYREARAYNHIERFCPGNEQIYFPQFHGVLAGLERSRFSSGYAQRRAVVLEAVKPKLRSRRILAADSNPMPKSFLLDIPLSSFEREWYWSLLCDRLRRLAALHRIGILHGDLYDHHFRLPDDFYDTVLFDFSASYTFTPRQPFRVNRGRPRPLEIISEGERTRVELQLQERAELRDFHSYLVDSMTESVVNYALHQSLEKEEGLLEAIILKVWTRPDYFSMVSLNSVFPFLEGICPEHDPAWHIRRGRLLNCYEAVWASLLTAERSSPSIPFYGEPNFEADGTNHRYYLLCLVPRGWNLLLRNRVGSATKEPIGYDKLRQFCMLFESSQVSGRIISRREFFGTGE